MAIYRKNAATQDLGPHFVRACAVEMHFQHFTRATLYGNLREKCRGPEPRTTLCASLRSRHAFHHFVKGTSHGNFQQKCRGPEPRTRLCASLRSRNTLQHFARATLYRNLQEKWRGADFVRACAVAFEHFTKAALNGNSQDKCCAPEWAQNADGLCASLSSIHVLGGFTRATLYGHLQEKCGPAGAPWSSTGLHNCRKNP